MDEKDFHPFSATNNFVFRTHRLHFSMKYARDRVVKYNFNKHHRTFLSLLGEETHINK